MAFPPEPKINDNVIIIEGMLHMGRTGTIVGISVLTEYIAEIKMDDTGEVEDFEWSDFEITEVSK